MELGVAQPLRNDDSRYLKPQSHLHHVYHRTQSRSHPRSRAGINSLIIKLSKLTKAEPVFRGLAGNALPDGFFKKNEDGLELPFSLT